MLQFTKKKKDKRKKKKIMIESLTTTTTTTKIPVYLACLSHNQKSDSGCFNYNRDTATEYLTLIHINGGIKEDVKIHSIIGSYIDIFELIRKEKNQKEPIRKESKRIDKNR